jgi:peptidyl-prolyl cis-trans isomerase C
MRARAWGAVLAVVLVAGCSQGEPGKDVAAVVAGEKITTAELDRELRLAGVQKPDDPALRRAALDEIIARKLLAKAARTEGLDKNPEVLAAKASADEAFDANLDRLATASKVAPPTAAEVTAFVAAHPEMFARRTGYLIDQLQVPTRDTPDLIEALTPTKTIEEAAAVLRARGIPFRRAILPMDTLRTDPRLSAAVAKLPPGEPFILPGVMGFTVNRVRGSQLRPVTGAPAETIARELIRADRLNKALRERLAMLRKDRVEYGPAFAETPSPREAAAK